MNSFTRQLSSTSYPIPILMLDSSDHITGKTGLTLTVTISKNGGAFGAAAGAVSEVGNGLYMLAGNATDRNTLGTSVIRATATGAEMVPVCVDIVTHDEFAMPAAVRTEMDNNSTQLQAIVDGLGRLAVGSGGISTTASAFTKSGAEPETNTYTATAAEDNVYHIVEDVANTTDAYYQFNIGSAGVPQSVEWQGYAQSNGDSYAAYFYNWSTTSWQQVGTISGANGTTQKQENFAATTAHVGTGSNVGLVRFRFYSTDGTAFATDRILCTYTQIVQGIVNGSTITLSATTTNANYIGHGWTLALGGQDIGGSYFYQSISVTGIGTCSNGSPPIFQECAFGAATLSAEAFIDHCAIADTLTFTSTAGVAADTVNIPDCFSNVPGPSTPLMDFSGVTKATYVNIRRWSGGLRLTLTADCTVSVDTVSGGTITINGTGGIVNIRGIVEGVTDNTGGAATITQTATLNRPFIKTQCDTALTDYDPPTNAEMEARTISSASADKLELSAGTIVTGAAVAGTLSTTQMTTNLTEATDDHYNGRVILWTSGNLQNQATDITDYDGGTKMLTYTAVTEAPVATDSFVIV